MIMLKLLKRLKSKILHYHFFYSKKCILLHLIPMEVYNVLHCCICSLYTLLKNLAQSLSLMTSNRCAMFVKNSDLFYQRDIFEGTCTSEDWLIKTNSERWGRGGGGWGWGSMLGILSLSLKVYNFWGHTFNRNA